MGDAGVGMVAGTQISSWMETAITWDCYQTLQLLLKVHNVFAQLDVIHPAETEKAWSDMQTPLCVDGIGQISSDPDLSACKGTLTLFTHPV